MTLRCQSSPQCTTPPNPDLEALLYADVDGAPPRRDSPLSLSSTSGRLSNFYRLTFQGVFVFSPHLALLNSTILFGASEPSHEFDEHERDTPNVNVRCALTQDWCLEPFFFAENSVAGAIYCDILEIFVFPQIDEIATMEGPIYLQQNGALPPFHNHIRHVLDDKFQEPRILRGGSIDTMASKETKVNSMDFFWSCVKDVYIEIRNLHPPYENG
ncbi:hypothetical protein J6590_064231 [Homalodisca vitripennis]|nr:hypothetical protein J6590_064231 [Homalodisca vitripennis]